MQRSIQAGLQPGGPLQGKDEGILVADAAAAPPMAAAGGGGLLGGQATGRVGTQAGQGSAGPGWICGRRRRDWRARAHLAAAPSRGLPPSLPAQGQRHRECPRVQSNPFLKALARQPGPDRLFRAAPLRLWRWTWAPSARDQDRTRPPIPDANVRRIGTQDVLPQGRPLGRRRGQARGRGEGRRRRAVRRRVLPARRRPRSAEQNQYFTFAEPVTVRIADRTYRVDPPAMPSDPQAPGRPLQSGRPFKASQTRRVPRPQRRIPGTLFATCNPAICDSSPDQPATDREARRMPIRAASTARL